jgi:hypothetical protein
MAILLALCTGKKPPMETNPVLQQQSAAQTQQQYQQEQQQMQQKQQHQELQNKILSMMNGTSATSGRYLLQ